jgi:hypothetical protein
MLQSSVLLLKKASGMIGTAVPEHLRFYIRDLFAYHSAELFSIKTTIQGLQRAWLSYHDKFIHATSSID